MTDNIKPSALQRTAEMLTIWGGWALLFLAFLTAFEVIARKYFLFSIQGVDEIGGYVLAICSAIGFSYGVLCRSHIRVDILLQRLPLSTRLVLEWVASLGMMVFAITLVWRTFFVLARTISLEARSATPLETPLIYPQGAWLVALLFFAGATVIAFWRVSQTLFLGHHPGELTMSPLDDEIRAEIADARRRLSREKNWDT